MTTATKTVIELTAAELIEVLSEKTGEQIKHLEATNGDQVQQLTLVINRAGFSPAKNQ